MKKQVFGYKEPGRVRLHIVGDMPGLLMNAPSGMAAPSGSSIKGKTVIPTPDDEAHRGAYRTEDNHLYVQSIAFRNAAVEAAKGRKIGKNSASMIIGQSVFPALDGRGFERKCILTWDGDPLVAEKGKGYVVDTRRAKVGDAGVMRSRALVVQWETVVELQYETDEINEYIILDAMIRAGRIVGVGDYRPRPPKGKGGCFGRFGIYRAEIWKDSEWAYFEPRQGVEDAGAGKKANRAKGKAAAE